LRLQTHQVGDEQEQPAAASGEGAGKKQNISSGFSVFLSVGHLGKWRWVTSEKRRRLAVRLHHTMVFQNLQRHSLNPLS
jgi:hypothetical protein